MIDNIATYSDRYDHDMTAEKFLRYLRSVKREFDDVPRGPDSVRWFLHAMGYNVVDTCYETATLIDGCGCRTVRALPTPITRAMLAIENYLNDVKPVKPMFTLIDALEARI